MYIEIDIDLIKVEKWAYTAEYDKEFEYYYDNDQDDDTDRAIINACSLEDIYRFAADPLCLKRAYFASMLIDSLSQLYKLNKLNLPFQFSRMSGIIDEETYLEECQQRTQKIYKISLIIDRMRKSDDLALKAVAKSLLDYRYNLTVMRKSQSDFNAFSNELMRDLLPLFEVT